MGQSAEQSRDDFKDIRGEEDLSLQNSRRNSELKQFQKCLLYSLKTRTMIFLLNTKISLYCSVLHTILTTYMDDLITLQIIQNNVRESFCAVLFKKLYEWFLHTDLFMIVYGSPCTVYSVFTKRMVVSSHCTLFTDLFTTYYLGECAGGFVQLSISLHFYLG